MYSIDEAFWMTNYLPLPYHGRELGQSIMADITRQFGIPATCGIRTNLYLAKIALDITAKHAADCIGYLDEIYRKTLWDHKPLTDFWRIGKALPVSWNAMASIPWAAWRPWMRTSYISCSAWMRNF